MRSLVMTAAYIARNPVEAGLCESADRLDLEQSRAADPGLHPSWLDSERLLEYFGAHGGDGLARYTSLVDELIQRLPKGDSPLYGPEEDERSEWADEPEDCEQDATAAGAAQTIQGRRGSR